MPPQRPSDPHFGVEFLRQLQEDLAMAEAARTTAAELRARADVLEKGAIARQAAVEDRLTAAIAAAAAAEVPPAREPRRPRLEEGDPPARERAAEARALIQRHPHMSTREVARRSRVHRDVVKRIRRELEVAEKVVGNPRKPRVVVEKGSQ